MKGHRKVDWDVPLDDAAASVPPATTRKAEERARARLAEALGVPRAFPWQEALLGRFLQGCPPRAVDVPTGLGKTAVMAAWLVARACGANLPRRLVYVVDRRVVVDQATDVALALRKFVDAKPEVKAGLGLGDRPLPVSTLRGQFVDNREWLDDPAAPAVVVGTVDMVGSRLLFEGYGVSRKMRPYHAGLLGADSLIVVDEAHLVPPFEHLMQSIATDPMLRGSDERCGRHVPRCWLLALSATGRTSTDDLLSLTAEDFAHEVVKKRLHAPKSLRIELLDEDAKLEEGLAERAWRLSGEGRKPVRILVYADSREVARKAKQAVEKRAKGNKATGQPSVSIDTELFVGGRRVFEREKAKQRLAELGFLAGSAVERKAPVFLFATSAAEVGVDLDADHMVCDLVAWERMVQRIGRVNRRGDGRAEIVVVDWAPKPTKKEQEALAKRDHDEPLTEADRKALARYDDRQRERRTHRAPFEHLPKMGDGAVDVSPGALHELKQRAVSDVALANALRDATTPEPLRPQLTRALVDAWAMTSLDEHPGRPAIQPWLRGWVQDDPAQTAVVWRTHLPVRADGSAPRTTEIERFFEAAPPHMSEILETETYDVVDWVDGIAKRLAKPAANVRKEASHESQRVDEAVLRDDELVAFVLGPDGRLRQMCPLEKLANLNEDALAGATLVVDARLAGLTDGLLDPGSSKPPRTADDGQPWLQEGSVGFRVRRVDSSAEGPSDPQWRERFRMASDLTEDGEVTRWLVVDKWKHDAATEEDRSAAYPQLLDEHQSWTDERARGIGKALGLDQAWIDLLALAARLHDEGKRASRWQRAFHAPTDGIYAKTEGPIDHRLLDGYRHELGSLLRIEGDEQIRHLSEEDRDLVLHLVTAHHGFARPVIDTSGCDDAPPSVLERKVGEIALRFARLQRRYGPWGLAWLEALLRAADQQASRDNDERNAHGGTR